MSRILCIDFGLKRTGIAVSDPMQIIASALITLPTQEVMEYLKKYFQQENVETIVVGYPLGLDGKQTDATVHVENFITQLKNNFPHTKIATLDERFTSVIAQRTMVEMGMKKKERRNKENIDKIAATILLQDYLATKK